MGANWSRRGAWAVAIPMICLSTGLGWHLANRAPTTTVAATASEPEQLPPVLAQGRVPLPPPRRLDELPTEAATAAPDERIMQASYGRSDSGYRVDKNVADVGTPTPAVDESQAATRLPQGEGADMPIPPSPAPAVRSGDPTKPQAGANRAAQGPRRSRINGIIRFEDE